MYLLFDIGGTKTRLAYSSDGEKFKDPFIFETPQDFDEGMKAFESGVEKVAGGKKIEKSSGGIRGVIDKEKSMLINDSRLKGWVGKPLKKSLQDVFGSDVFLENDTAMIGLGEAIHGAGRGFEIVAYLTISTGIGGARIVNQKIDMNSYNTEPGHQIIDADYSICRYCGTEIDQPGAFEALASGDAFEKRFGKKPEEIQPDDPIWSEVSKLIAVGVNNTVVYWSPDVVVLGGGMMRSPGIKMEVVESELKQILKIYPSHPVIKKAELGDFGGLHGALHYLRSQVS
ncbi:ROK family protein [Candidatus Woesebacteria bacterium]|nr:ROK family protein [Candidatus Woesebacteria bacterium]